MTIIRDLTTIEDALVRIANQVPGGYDSMGLRLGYKGGDIVRKWSNPANPTRMTYDAIVPLDLLYAEHGGTGAPLYELLVYLREEAHTGAFAQARELAAATIDVAREAGEAVAALIAASQSGASAELKLKARQEVAELDAAISRVAPQLNPEAEAPP